MPIVYSHGNTIKGNTIYISGLYTLTNGPDESQYGIQLCLADDNTILDNEIYGHNGQSWYVTTAFAWELDTGLHRAPRWGAMTGRREV
ncbi:MAG: hypothetical protein V3U20_07685 [Thermoplasmata archaeon]